MFGHEVFFGSSESLAEVTAADCTAVASSHLCGNERHSQLTIAMKFQFIHRLFEPSASHGVNQIRKRKFVATANRLQTKCQLPIYSL